MMDYIIFEPILKKYFLTIASGATPIGSAERAPDDISWQALEECYSHWERVFMVV
jgi:hypothetical protein